jgi:hypothetical protein
LRVLVAGGAEYIGIHASKMLARTVQVPIVIDDLSAGNEWAVRWGTFKWGNIGDRRLVAQVLHDEKIDAALHSAASAYGGESMAQPQSEDSSVPSPSSGAFVRSVISCLVRCTSRLMIAWVKSHKRPLSGMTRSRIRR